MTSKEKTGNLESGKNSTMLGLTITTPRYGNNKTKSPLLQRKSREVTIYDQDIIKIDSGE